MPDCKNEYVDGVTFHPFPTDPRLRELWELGSGYINPVKNNLVCSNHFAKQDFEEGGDLKATAVPKADMFKVCGS